VTADDETVALALLAAERADPVAETTRRDNQVHQLRLQREPA